LPRRGDGPQDRRVAIDADGVLIDGRNRLEACKLAKVEPTYERLNGHDAEAFIWSSNAKRRQMVKGQIAMVAAMRFICATEINPADGKRAKPDRARGL
jgi:hypothetical protein